MESPFFKKIISIEEWKSVAKDIGELFIEDNEKFGHAHDLKHDADLITKSLSHESLLIWNIHVWSHFNGEKWDAIFIGIIRKSEKFNKKVMDEYLWLSKNPKAGFKLYKLAEKYAKEQGCEYISMNVVENHPLSEKIKSLYKKLDFKKDCETYMKKL